MPLVYGVTQQVLINAYIASETLALNNTIDYIKGPVYYVIIYIWSYDDYFMRSRDFEINESGHENLQYLTNHRMNSIKYTFK